MRLGTNTVRADDRIGWSDVEWLVPFFKTAAGPQKDKVQFRREIHEVMSAAAALRERDRLRRAEQAAAAALEQAELARAIHEIGRTATSLRQAETAETIQAAEAAPALTFWSRHRRRILMWLAIGGIWSVIALTVLGLAGTLLVLMR